MFHFVFNKKMKPTMLIGALLVLIFLVSVGAFLGVLASFGMTAGQHQEAIEVTIAKGSSPKAIGALLQQKGVINSARMFYWYLRYIEQCVTCLKAGDYLISAKSSPSQIIALLISGREREYRFTIPEGSNKEEIARIIASSGLATRIQILDAMSDPYLMYEFGVPNEGAGGQDGVGGGMEGYLFPDTYQFPKGTPPEDILRTMRWRLDEMFTQDMQDRMKELKWNFHQALTMASIIEKETNSEHTLVSSVFHNRLKKRMKLQTDPTSIYGTGYKGRIKGSHVRKSHIYNTYIHYGLPPGPIGSAGMASLEAALWPAKSPYLFFVSQGNGTHLFCENYGCHQKGINQYRKKLNTKKNATVKKAASPQSSTHPRMKKNGKPA